jgi:hypothetical protein
MQTQLASAIEAAGVGKSLRGGPGSNLHFPEATHPEQPEKVGKAVAGILTSLPNGFVPDPKVQDVNPISRMIADQVLKIRGAALPAETGKATPTTRMKAPTNKRVAPGESPFMVKSMVEAAGMPEGPDDAWMVVSKEGGEQTNIHIAKVKNNRYEVKIGNKLMKATTSPTAAKMEGIAIAERQLWKAAEKNTPFHVPGVGAYSPLGEFSFEDADGNPTQRMMYQFVPEGTNKPVNHSMPVERWEHIRDNGTPINPMATPSRGPGRPANTQTPPLKMTAPPPAQ